MNFYLSNEISLSNFKEDKTQNITVVSLLVKRCLLPLLTFNRSFLGLKDVTYSPLNVQL